MRAHKKGQESPAFIKAPPDNWAIADHDDLAVMLIDDGRAYQVERLEDMNLTDEVIDEYSIGIGDEVVSVGRFVDLTGHRINRPLVRSGVIAAMPEFPVTRKEGAAQDSYIVEMRSRSGFSGSPVYVYLPPPQIRFVHSDKQTYTSVTGKALIKFMGFYGPWLLGVHWGEIKVEGPDLNPHLHASVLSDDRKGIELGSGMIGVIPCSRLEALLMKNDRLAKERKRIEKDSIEQAVEQSASPSESAGGENPEHREDFTRLLNAAVRKREQED